MKIDIHTHTKKCKTGDAPTRDVTPIVFCEKIQSTEVGIVAITNHNVFDLKQYNEIIDNIKGTCLVWPGIELDIMDGANRGHLLVIVSPSAAEDFAYAVDTLCIGSTADNFTTTIELVLEHFECFGPLYVAHYKQKKPAITDSAIESLISGTSNPCRVIKEVTNSIAAGIYISHGHASIYGSDVHDWATYQEQALLLPDLRLPVESFEHFCLLLTKDPTTINTVLDQKISEELKLRPFEDGTSLQLRIYNDINVIFGPKGTGKSCILESIAKHYVHHGIEARVYESASDKLDDIFDIKGNDISLNLDTYEIHYCKDEIEALRKMSEIGVTSINKYVNYFQTETTNRNAKNIKLKEIEPEESGNSKREFSEFAEAVTKTNNFLDFIKTHTAVGKVLDESERRKLIDPLEVLLNELVGKRWKNFSEWKETELLNSAINTFRMEIERKTGSPAKPTTTGFRDYARNRMQAEISTKNILKNLNTNIRTMKEVVGSLGSNKGTLELRTEFIFQNGKITDGSLNSVTSVKKRPQKEFAKAILEIQRHAYDDKLFHHIGKLNDIDDIEKIQTVYELLQFKKFFAIGEHPYTPSSGEASMVMLHKELETEKEIYLLDEPERSLGNEYINDVIVPLIKSRAKAGKKIVISTHDANIAVRTLPYCSIYRYHDVDGYATFVGNPFSNNLVCRDDESRVLDWKKTSMKTLEGGEEAFGERGNIYGNY